MNTQSHIILASALFTRSGVSNRARNIAAVSGGFFPDFPIFLMFLWSKIVGAPESEVWEKWYFGPPWRDMIDFSHSFPVYWVLAMFAVLIVKWGGKYSDWGIIMVIFALSATTHAMGDFFLHVKDGHAHFWPLSDWRFASPVSYWDPRYYGQYFSIFEIIMGVWLCYILYKRFQVFWVRVFLLLAIVAYIAVPAYFIFVVKHHPFLG